MGYVTEKELHDIAKSLVELNRSCNAFNKTLNKIMDKLMDAGKLAAETVKDEAGWIKINCEDDCPKDQGAVLIKCVLGQSAWWFGEYHVATYTGGYWNVETRDDVENYLDVEVTHWRPIPKL